ncbi:MAG: hypothetical protein AAGI01_02530 [Myxococcota bacterium]
MMRRWVAYGVTMALGAVVGCGDPNVEPPLPEPDATSNNTTSNTSGGGSALEWKDPERFVHELVCAELFACQEYQFFDGAFPIFKRYSDEASCLQDTSIVNGYVEREAIVNDGIASGRVVVDASAFEACQTDLAAARDAAQCSGLRFEVPDSCDESKIFTGAVSKGQPCLHPRECVQGVECYQENNSRTCYATCEDYTPCGNINCGPDEYCQVIGNRSECRAYKSNMQTCSSSQECGRPGEGLCDFFASPEESLGKCVAVTNLQAQPEEPELMFAGLAEPCGGDTRCERPYLCVEGACASSPFSTATAGEECDRFFADGTIGCELGSVCRIIFTLDEEENPVPSSSCDAPAVSGEPCLFVDECATGLRCVGASPSAPRQGVCTSLAGIAEECVEHYDCESGRCAPFGEVRRCASRTSCDVPAAM